MISEEAFLFVSRNDYVPLWKKLIDQSFDYFDQIFDNFVGENL